MLSQRVPHLVHSLGTSPMTDYREIHAICNDLARVHRIAAHLLSLKDMDWTEWEIDFLNAMLARTEPLSTRQGEILVELRDNAVLYDKVDGFVLKTLVERCWLYRDELSESNCEFIERLKTAVMTSLRKPVAERLLRCARMLQEIGPHQGWDFPTRIKL